ncbi:MAG: YeeE/YedE thiosulfate transporter family protein [Streptosporangiaceae bacterium]
MVAALAAGAAAGSGIGYVLQRGQLCFHSMFASALAGRTLLLRGWLLGVAVTSVGLSLLYLTPWSRGLNTGLPFTPVSDIVGGLVIGAGMVVASSCASGLFYKLGSGMLGALAGLAGWVAGELAVRHLHLPGGSRFGASTVGASASVASGSPNWWLIAFLLAIVAGAAIAARTAGGWQLRGETPVRYGRLAAGGFLLGAGGWIAGGCNLGHGLSGTAQLNVSSWVVVASMAAG